jgi:toxin YoeB
MEVEYKKKALADRDYWKASGKLSVQKRISELINDICAHPFTGIGKPEPLKYDMTGLWSRRITRDHRLIYEVLNGRISIISMKDHY